MRKYLCLFLLVTFILNSLWSQISIIGPVCVKAGTEYQYIIDAKWVENARAKISVTGGVIAESGQTTIASDVLGSVKVVWNEKTSTGRISFSSAMGDATIDVNMAADLNPGSLAVSKLQDISFNTKAAVINCTAASGGNCSPSFSYQWQWSENALEWNDIPGANTQNLPGISVLKEPVFYRRQVTEKVSGDIGYSETATVFVKPDLSK